LSDGKPDEATDKAHETARLLPRAQFPGFAAANDWLDVILARAQTKANDVSDAATVASGQSL
jgi:hypothetical protein